MDIWFEGMRTAAQVVKRRGESMAAAAKQSKPHGMLSIIGLGDAVLEDVCAKARAKLGGDTVCRIANYLFPTGRVASGHKDALAEVLAPHSPLPHRPCRQPDCPAEASALRGWNFWRISVSYVCLG